MQKSGDSDAGAEKGAILRIAQIKVIIQIHFLTYFLCRIPRLYYTTPFSRGSHTVTVVPTPGALASARRPPWAATISRTIPSPNPLDCGLRIVDCGLEAGP